MAKQKGGADFQLIERIFNQLSSSVSIALVKEDKLSYEFYGGRKAALTENNGDQNIFSVDAKAAGGKSAKAGRGFMGFGVGKGAAAKDADKRDDSSVNRTTRFMIGSASELFTGALIVKLMEFGEVSLGDGVRKFIPEFPFDDTTVYHLLTHTSGLNSDHIAPPENYAASRDFYRRLYEKIRRDCDSGVKSDHFKYGYSVLADITCRVSGQTLEELASVLIFMPLGMKYTTYNGSSLRDNQYVTPWNHKENRFMNELHAKPPTGQNGVYTTSLDLIRFGKLLISGGEFEGKSILLESSVDFLLREVTGGKFMRTPLFMIKRQVDIFGCFSEKMSADSVALTGDTGNIIFVDPLRKVVGAALTNSTWVHSISRNYSNIIDILMSI